MADITPFQAIRPESSITERFAALPYDVYNRQEAAAEVKREPLSFLKIDRAETLMDPDIDLYDPAVYQKAHDLLWSLVDSGELIQDSQSSYYLYELTMNGRSQTGIVACASVDDYLNGVIRKHENTRADKELDRNHHVDACDAQTGPIFLAYRNNKILKNCMKQAKEQNAIFDFVSPDGIRHRGWQISSPDLIGRIQQAFSEISQIYIADGHHRAASAVKVSLKRREQDIQDSGREHEYERFLSVLFSEDELYIMDYNRVVKDLNENTPEDFLKKIREIADLTECTNPEDLPFRPKEKGEIGMYLQGSWYRMHLHNQVIGDPVEALDVSALQREVLDPILGIKDPKTDQRISFVGGIRGLRELEQLADTAGGVAFSMYPTSMQELFCIADVKRLMPPKSTWFEPKLRSGLFIHSIRE